MGFKKDIERAVVGKYYAYARCGKDGTAVVRVDNVRFDKTFRELFCEAASSPNYRGWIIEAPFLDSDSAKCRINLETSVYLPWSRALDTFGFYKQVFPLDKLHFDEPASQKEIKTLKDAEKKAARGLSNQDRLLQNIADQKQMYSAGRGFIPPKKGKGDSRGGFIVKGRERRFGGGR